MKITLVLATVAILLSGCASVPTEQVDARKELAQKYHLRFDQSSDFSKAIKDGNLPAVDLFMKTLSGYPYRDVEKNTVWSGSMAMQEAFGQPKILAYFIAHPATTQNDKIKVWDAIGNHLEPKKCFDETIGILLLNADVPSPLLVHNLATYRCDKILVDVIAKYPQFVDEEFFRRNIESDIELGNRSAGALDTERFDRLNFLVPHIHRATQVGCSKGDIAKCQIADKFKKIEADLAQISVKRDGLKAELEQEQMRMSASEEESQRQEKSGETALSRACQADADSKGFQKQLAYQQEIERTSGVRNLEENYRLGQLIVSSKGFMKAMAEEYKSKSGRTFTLADCKKIKKD